MFDGITGFVYGLLVMLESVTAGNAELSLLSRIILQRWHFEYKGTS